jgi:hypothetical protein
MYASLLQTLSIFWSFYLFWEKEQNEFSKTIGQYVIRSQIFSPYVATLRWEFMRSVLPWILTYPISQQSPAVQISSF